MIRQFPIPHEALDGSVEDTPLVKLWYAVLAESLNRGYERLHLLLPKNSHTFSILGNAQGSWQSVMTPPAQMYAAFVQRLKVMASFSMVRRPLVEDGRFRFAHKDAVVDIGVTVRTAPDGSQDAIIDLSGRAVATGE